MGERGEVEWVDIKSELWLVVFVVKWKKNPFASSDAQYPDLQMDRAAQSSCS